MMSTGQNALRRFGDSLIGCWGDRTLQSERESLTLRELLDKPWMRADTAVGDAARYFADTLAGNLGAAIYTDKYLPIIRGQPPEHPRPFLSVVMRTQLYRPETLTEALLSLTAQSDRDFEVLLIPHKVEDSALAEIRAIVESFPPSFQAQIRLLPLNEGNRTAPLNYGFANAWGEYASVLDDDDVVMDHWVADFREGAVKSPCTVVRAYAVNQDWKTVRTADGERALSAASAPRADYCKPYSAFIQTRVNRCPIFSLAFPLYATRELGYLFNEELTTTEDWDFVRRVTALCGVTEIPRVTGIYRLWTDGKTSHSTHRQEEWKRNYDRITDAQNSYPILTRRSEADAVEHLSYLADADIPIEQLTSGESGKDKTIRDLESIIKAQKVTIAALETKSFQGRLVRTARLIFHRIRGDGGGDA